MWHDGHHAQDWTKLGGPPVGLHYMPFVKMHVQGTKQNNVHTLN